MNSDAVFRTFITKLKNPNYRIRNQAAHALGRLRDPRAIPFLIDVLGDFDQNDEESKVNMTASSVLITFGELALEPLIQALEARPAHQKDGWRRYWTAETLGFFHDQQAITALIDVLQDTDHEVVEGAAEGLARIGADTALLPLQQALSRFKPTDGYIYTALSHAIGVIQDR